MTNLNKFKCPTPLFLIFICCMVSCTQTQKKSPESVTDTSLKTNVEVADTTSVYGIDVSHYQGAIDWSKIGDLDFAICKATQGITYTDVRFQTNWNALKSQNIIRGAYHFFVSSDDPIAQSKHLLGTVNDYSKGDLPLIIDIENGSIDKDTVDTTQLVQNLLTMLQFIEQNTQVKPIIYTNTSFVKSYLSDSRLATYPLWIANYTTNQNPEVPAPWSPDEWLFWQKADTYDLDAQNDNVDLDLFHGSLEKLHTITKQ